MTSKLRLKRTPEEEARRRVKKRKHRHEPSEAELKEKERAEEEARFREKLYDAMEDDGRDDYFARIDQLENKLNDYAHVPDRWRTPGTSKGTRNYYNEDDDEWMKMDPRHMDDEEYAEWVRAGMYRKTHAQEYEERKQKKAAERARREREKALKEETKRIEKEEEQERAQRRQERERRRWERAYEVYERQWQSILDARDTQLEFIDIPWPVRSNGDRIVLDDISLDAVSSFLFRETESRKEKLRETMLRYHPDKFEGRVLRRVQEADRQVVQEMVGQVARVLNELMGQ